MLMGFWSLSFAFRHTSEGSVDQLLSLYCEVTRHELVLNFLYVYFHTNQTLLVLNIVFVFLWYLCLCLCNDIWYIDKGTRRCSAGDLWATITQHASGGVRAVRISCSEDQTLSLRNNSVATTSPVFLVLWLALLQAFPSKDISS